MAAAARFGGEGADGVEETEIRARIEIARRDHRDLDAAIEACLQSEVPYFLDVRVHAAENCFPMIPAGRGHHEVLLGKDRPFAGARAAPRTSAASPGARA